MPKIKSTIKSLLGKTIFGLGLDGFLFADSAAIVSFHRVNNKSTGGALTCSVEKFKKYCTFFADYFHVVPLRQLVEKIENGAQLKGELAITFDDGYRDNYEYAAPVLQAKGLPATFFVVSGFIETEFVPWWDLRLGIREPWMTWEEVRWLIREGFEIGAHTRSHVDLSKVFGNQAREEIFRGRLDLEERLSTRVDLFAYPYGRESQMAEKNRELVKAAGLRCCCSCFGGINVTGIDPFYLRRIPITSWYQSPYQFGCDVALNRF